MSEQTKPEANPDDLTKTTETESSGACPELTDEDLEGVSGGGWDVRSEKPLAADVQKTASLLGD